VKKGKKGNESNDRGLGFGGRGPKGAAHQLKRTGGGQMPLLKKNIKIIFPED